MAKHCSGGIWMLRWPPKKRPNGLVKTMSKKEIGIRVDHDDGTDSQIILDRRTARLVAKRILQCLEVTK